MITKEKLKEWEARIYAPNHDVLTLHRVNAEMLFELVNYVYKEDEVNMTIPSWPKCPSCGRLDKMYCGPCTRGDIHSKCNHPKESI